MPGTGLELEIACVIGREGKNIALEETSDYIAGYTIMNDWSARDFQRKDMRLRPWSRQRKDFATSLAPASLHPTNWLPVAVAMVRTSGTI